MKPIAVLWPYPRHSFYIDYPELRGRKILFVQGDGDLERLRGIRDAEFILGGDSYMTINISVVDEFIHLVRYGDFKEYCRAQEKGK